MSDTDATPTTPDPPTNVIQALARVMADLPGIGKSEHSEQGYNYRGIESITRHAQHLLGRYGVVFVPRVLSRNVKEFSINSRPWTEDQAEVVYRVYGPGGTTDYIDVGPLWGLGRDNSDKGMNKAMTQAFKYALTQTLCVGDGQDDPDREQAHQADAPPPPMDPHREARSAVGLRIRQLSPASRDKVRAWCDEHQLSRVPAQWNDEQLAAAEETVDRLVQEEAATAHQPAVGAPSAPEGTTAPPAPETAPVARPSGLMCELWEWCELDAGHEGQCTDALGQQRPADAPQPEPDAEAVIAYLAKLSKPDLVDALGLRDLPTTGNMDTLRQRLGVQLLKEGWTPPQPALA